MQNYYNYFESPQTTEHLEIPMAACNHLKYCTECKIVLSLEILLIAILSIMVVYQISIINQVLEYEQKNRVKVYEREFKPEHLTGPIK